MLSTDKQVASPARALEAMSRRCHLPQSEVTRLCERELAGPISDARINSFLPIFAVRKLEETLNHRRAAALAV